MREFLDYAKSDKVETVVVDPIGELMDKLKRHMIAMGDTKLVQKRRQSNNGRLGLAQEKLCALLKCCAIPARMLSLSLI